MSDLFSHPSDGANSGFDQSGWIGAAQNRRAVHVASLKVKDTGTYSVTVNLSDNGTLFGQRRNLIAPEASAGTHEFFICLTEYIPSMQSRLHTDTTLYASAFGSDIEFLTAERAEARRIFIAGDSTVADQYAF